MTLPLHNLCSVNQHRRGPPQKGIHWRDCRRERPMLQAILVLQICQAYFAAFNVVAEDACISMGCVIGIVIEHCIGAVACAQVGNIVRSLFSQISLRIPWACQFPVIQGADCIETNYTLIVTHNITSSREKGAKAGASFATGRQH